MCQGSLLFNNYFVYIYIVYVVLNQGFRAGASYKNRRLRNPVDILLLELMKAYIF